MQITRDNDERGASARGAMLLAGAAMMTWLAVVAGAQAPPPPQPTAPMQPPPPTQLAQPTPPGAPTVWDGVFSAAQAERGQASYMRSCNRCHALAADGLPRRFMGDPFWA